MCRRVVPKGDTMNHRCKIRRFLLLVVFLMGVAATPAMAGAEGPALTVTKESGISVNVDNEPLNALLRMMAEKKLLNIKGGVAGNESLTLHLSNLTLPEMLAKILRGYNYVVIDQGKDRLPVLTLMGKIQKGALTAHADAAAPADAPPEPRSYAPEMAPEPPPVSMRPGMTGRQPLPPQAQTPQDAQAGGDAQRQAGQQASGGQPAPQPEAPPAESPGVHF